MDTKFLDFSNRSEEWKEVPGYEGLYLVSNLGRVYSLGRNTCTRNISPSIIKQQKSKKGYPTVSLSDSNGYPKRRPVHRLVAMAFIPNSENKPQVNHINGIRDDNRIENLEWVTGSENVLHSFRVLGKKTVITEETRRKLSLAGKGKPRPKFCKPVLKLDRAGIVIQEYKSITEAANKHDTRPDYIQAAVSGRRKTAKGFIWRYKSSLTAEEANKRLQA